MATSVSKPRLETVQRDLEDVRSLTLCKVCLRPFYEPFILICGHTFCYGCLRSWFCGDTGRKKQKNCPECRTVIKATPAPNFALRDLAHMFFNRQELLPEDETIAEHKKGGLEEAKLLSTDRQTRGLFQGIFSRFEVPLASRTIHDIEDGVERCPQCNWEIEGEGTCTRCGWEDPDYDFSDIDQDSMVDMESEDDESIRYALGEGHMHDGMPQFYDIRSDADDSTAGTDRYGTPRPYDYGEDDEDDMEDFISDDEDEPSETDLDAHGWDGHISHTNLHNRPFGIDPDGFSELDHEPTSDISEETNQNETNAFSSQSSSDIDDGSVHRSQRFNRVLSDEEDDEDDNNDRIVTGVRDVDHTNSRIPNISDTDETDQHTNYDGSDSEEPVVTAVSNHRTGPKRRPHLVISDDDEEEDDEEERVEQTENYSREVSETSEDQWRAANPNQDDESHDSDDSTPPQSAAQRMRRLDVHQAARARRSTPYQDRAGDNRFNRNATTVRHARQPEPVTAANRSRGRPYRPSARVY